MYTKLTKEEMAQRTELGNRLHEAYARIESYLALVNDGVTNLNAAVDDYNNILNEAKSFAEDIANVIREEFDAKSERWQEGDRASAYANWREQWEAFDYMEEIEAYSAYDAPEEDASRVMLLDEREEPSNEFEF